jgi:organic radical activating enzyme
MAEALRIVPKALKHFATSPKAWFKYVVSESSDLAEIDALASRFSLSGKRILLMPEGRNSAQLDRHASEIAAACLERGWRFCDRLHVRLWGDRRGV